jgi:hypothetical protein
LKIKGLIWFDEIIDKLARKHRVSQVEVIEVLTNEPYFRFIERVIALVRMYMPQWGKPKMEGISLYFLFTRKMGVLLSYQVGI